MAEKKTVLITGGAGFIGSHTAKRLAQEGHEVIIVDNFNKYYDPVLKEARVRVLLGDAPHVLYREHIEDAEAMRRIFSRHTIDIVCHLAAQAGVRYAAEDPYAYGHTNLIGTLTLLEMAKEFHVQGVIFASSSSVYGAADHYPTNEKDTIQHPISLYAATKSAGEQIAYSYHHLYHIPITCLRFFTVYGPWGRPDMALFLFTKGALEEMPIDVYGQGRMARDFTYIDDIVDGIIRAMEKNFPWEVFNLGSGKLEELMDMITFVERYAGKTVEKRFLDMQPGDVRRSLADITKAKTLLGWEPKTSLERGVERFIDWYKTYHGYKHGAR